ncbi:hypothetical protein SLEP1_g28927 [Rubroshorea leprosula]|uniref:RanBP2-type domain-containing protein n=1 Tax=Rubroshorea leprosula TaxID=152421 RepID=A0AAV5JXT6_9ROSI|nr:hypothetical protein SLEP1_g28927 [Rubroshorea leprosula]
MAPTPFSRLLLRRFSLPSKTPPKPPSRQFSIFTISKRSFSTSPPPTPTQDPPKPSSLSARMSFVFEQIDQIEKQRREQFHQNDDTLQRIRAWRQSKKESQETQQPESNDRIQDSGIAENDINSGVLGESKPSEDALQRIRAWRHSNNPEGMPYPESETASQPVVELVESESGEVGEKKGEKAAELLHPWPEWIELMERLVQQNYFDHKRRDEDRMVQGLGFDISNVAEEVNDDAGIDFNDYKTVQTACINFGKDRFDILRSFSRQDIQILVGYGCPSTDKKVVFSSKLLRKRVHLDEGDVCSSCSLRNSCQLAYLLTNKEDEARTIDIMRVLLIYGFDFINGSVVNKDLLKQKSVKIVARKLLHEVVKLSAVPIDPNLPPPIIKKPPPKVKQPPPPPKKRVGRDDIEMKKGDWLCPKCDFMNFAKNTVCLQCDAKRPKRQLLPGEWECPECNFLNYRRNMACFHCDCKRPPDAFVENKMQGMQPGPRTRLEKVARQQEVSNAWNFDFDDDESDGADVAAFEHADTPVIDGDSPSDTGPPRGNFRGLGNDFNDGGQVQRNERDYSDPDSNRPGVGFDDFDDEDDVDSYEIDTQNSNPAWRAASNDFSHVEGFSESGGVRGFNHGSVAYRTARPPSYSEPSKSLRRKATFSDSELDFDSDGELAVHPNWKSSHVADSRHRSGGARVSSRGLSFGSDDEVELNSDMDDDFDDYGSQQEKGNRRGYSRGGFQRGGRFDVNDGSFSGPELENNGSGFQRNRSAVRKIGSGGRGNNFSSSNDYYFDKDAKLRTNSKMGVRRNDGYERSSRDSRGDNRFRADYYGSWRTDNREGYKQSEGFRDHKGGDYGYRRMNNRGYERGEGFRNQQRRRSDKYDRDRDWDPSEFRNSRRVNDR